MNSTLFVQSPLLASLAREVSHGFSTRLGGVSASVYASLNLGIKWGDQPGLVAENRRRLAAASGLGLDRFYLAQQVHGAAVVVVDDDATPAQIGERQADALFATGSAVLAVSTADCVPLLFSADGCRAAAHAGWRGTVAQIGARVVETFIAHGVKPTELRVALGPCICVRCFEVGEEVASEFAALTPAAVVRPSAGRPHIDLRRANLDILMAAGVPLAQIDANPPCTMCDPTRFLFLSSRRQSHRCALVLYRPSWERATIALGTCRREPDRARRDDFRGILYFKLPS